MTDLVCKREERTVEHLILAASKCAWPKTRVPGDEILRNRSVSDQLERASDTRIVSIKVLSGSIGRLGRSTGTRSVSSLGLTAYQQCHSMGRYPNINVNMSAQQAYTTNDFGYLELCMHACLIVTHGFGSFLHLWSLIHAQFKGCVPRIPVNLEGVSTRSSPANAIAMHRRKQYQVRRTTLMPLSGTWPISSTSLSSSSPASSVNEGAVAGSSSSSRSRRSSSSNSSFRSIHRS